MKLKGSLMIVLLLAVLLLPMTAGAETKTGKCGDNLTYTLTDDGTLTISGTGAMYYYSDIYSNGRYITTAPWKDAPKKVVIEAGVTSIGHYAFFDCSSLTSITIPDSVTSIGDSAFSFCDSLTSMTIPSSVTSIGDYAFYYCSSLTSITIPEGVTSIGDSTFSVCSSLTSVTIPSSVTSIGDFAFEWCDSLTSVTIPSSVTSIGNRAFFHCDILTDVTIPDTVVSIGKNAFAFPSGDNFDIEEFLPGQESFTIFGKGGSAAEAYAMSHYTNFEYPDVVPNCNHQWTETERIREPEHFIVGFARYRCDLCQKWKLHQIIITHKWSDWIFVAKYQDSYTFLRYCLADGCYWVERWDTDDYFIHNELNFPANVSIIEDEAFAKTRFSHVFIPDGCTTIGSRAFADCKNLIYVRIPASVTSIADDAFEGCPAQLVIEKAE